MSAGSPLGFRSVSQKFRVGVIGAGCVGPPLACALALAGHTIVGISASSEDDRERAEALLPGVRCADPDVLARESDLLLFAIPATELLPLVQGFTRLGVFRPGQILVHTVAEFGYSVFETASTQGVIPLAIHPGIAFTGTSLDVDRLRHSFAAVSAPAAMVPIAQALCLEMGVEPIVIEEGRRKEYAENAQRLRRRVHEEVAHFHDFLLQQSPTAAAPVCAAFAHAYLEETLRTLAD